MKYILALDQGTTSSRAILFDRAGAIQAIAQQEFTQYFPEDGWVEHDPLEIWKTQLAVAQEVLEKSQQSVNEIAAIGITNQRETAVVWNRKTGEPICPAIVWQDRRTAGRCEELRQGGHGADIQSRTGLVLDAYFSATKVEWILNNVANAAQLAESGELCFGTIDSWLVWNLTGGREHLTDVTNASRTLLYNIRAQEWDTDLLQLFNIPAGILPIVRSCSEIYAETDPELFGKSLPIAGIAGDQQAAMFGQLCLEPGMVKNTYGTGAFLLLNTGDQVIESKHQLLSTIAWKRGEETVYALEGSVFIAGAVVQWLRDGLGIIKKSSEIEQLAGQVSDNGGIYLVPAFAGLGAPHWDPYARGVVCGITRATTAGHFARAAVESMAFQVNEVLSAMRSDSGIEISELRVDGGAAANDFLLQFQSDISRVSLQRPHVREMTAQGAAFHAGLAVGFWDSVDELSSLREVETTISPQMGVEDAQRMCGKWQAAVDRAKGWSHQNSG